MKKKKIFIVLLVLIFLLLFVFKYFENSSFYKSVIVPYSNVLKTDTSTNGDTSIDGNTDTDEKYYPVDQVKYTHVSSVIYTNYEFEGGTVGSVVAQLYPSVITNPAMSYRSGDESIVTIEQKDPKDCHLYNPGYWACFKLIPQSQGKTTVTFWSDDMMKEETFDIEVKTYLEEIKISDEYVVLYTNVSEQNSYQINPVIYPENANENTELEISMIGSDDFISLDDNGLVTAVENGIQSVVVKPVKGSALEKTIQFEVLTKVEGIALKDSYVYEITDVANSFQINPNSFQINPIFTPSTASNQNLTYTSSNEEVATISADGVVTCHSNGETVISVVTEEGNFTDSATLSVTTALNSIEIVPERKYNIQSYDGYKNTPVLVTNEDDTNHTLQMNVNYVPETASSIYKGVTWTSSNESVAIVDESGLITPIADGYAVICAVSNHIEKKVCQSFYIYTRPDRVEINHDEVTLVINNSEKKEMQLKATVYPENARFKGIDGWSSSDKSVVTVSWGGLISAVAPGEAIVKVVTLDADRTDEVLVKVVTEVKGVSISNKEPLYVLEGEKIQLNSVITPVDATNQNVKWYSADESVAIVDDNGIVTGISSGNVEITVETEDGGLKNTVVVNVASKDYNFVDVVDDNVLYDNGLAFKIKDDMATISATNVKQIVKNDIYIKNNGELFLKKLDVTIPNVVSVCVKKFSNIYDYKLELYYLNSFGQIYYVSYDYNGELIVDELIKDNIKEIYFYDDVLYAIDNDNVLWAQGVNHFGLKFNDGVDFDVITDLSSFDEPIFNDIKEIHDNYLITNDKKMYYWDDDSLARPLLIAESVENVVVNDNDFVIYDGINTYNYILEIENSQLFITKENLNFEVEKAINKVYYGNNTLYNSDGSVIASDVLDFYEDFLYIDSNNTLKYFNDNYSSRNSFVTSITNISEIPPGIYSLLDNIIDIKDDYLILEDTNLVNMSTLNQIEGLLTCEDKIPIKQLTLNNVLREEYDVGEQFDYYAFVFPKNAADTTVLWENDNEEVVNVSDKGYITALSPGEANITIKSNNNLIDTKKLTVYSVLESITFSQGDEINYEYGTGTLKIDINPYPSNVRPQSYYYEVVEGNCYVSSNGTDLSANVDVYDVGVCKVKVSNEDDTINNIFTINVFKKVTSLDIYDLPDYLNVGMCYKLSVNYYPYNATNIVFIYSSSNSSVATIDEKGMITANMVGDATIKVCTDDNICSSKDIKVKQVEVPLLGDINSDGKVSILDLAKLRKGLAGLEEFSELQLVVADLNADGKVSILDLAKLRKVLAGLE